MTEEREVWIGIGSNLHSHFGTSPMTLKRCVHDIEQRCSAQDLIASSLYESVALTAEGYDPTVAPYYNAVVRCYSPLPPEQILKTLLEIESDAGRTRQSLSRWQSRPLDCDLLLAGDYQCHTSTLRLPHPEMLHRRFVMIPLLEIGDPIHPYYDEPCSRLFRPLTTDSQCDSVRRVLPASFFIG